MPYQITITTEAESQLRALTAREQRMIEGAIEARLSHRPTTPSKSRKQLRPNPLAQFELRVGDLRVLYNVEASEVIVLVVGRKVGNTLIVKGEAFHGHQDNSSESARGESPPDTQ